MTFKTRQIPHQWSAGSGGGDHGLAGRSLGPLQVMGKVTVDLDIGVEFTEVVTTQMSFNKGMVRHIAEQ